MTRKTAGRSRAMGQVTDTTADAATTAMGTGAAPSRDPEEIHADIERTRAELGESVEALAGKADVKGRAKEAVTTAKDRAKDTAQQVGQQVGEKVRRKPVRVVATLAAVAVAIAATVVVRRRRAASARVPERWWQTR